MVMQGAEDLENKKAIIIDMFGELRENTIVMKKSKLLKRTIIKLHKRGDLGN